jgi:hypothetical protein
MRLNAKRLKPLNRTVCKAVETAGDMPLQRKLWQPLAQCKRKRLQPLRQLMQTKRLRREAVDTAGDMLTTLQTKSCRNL